MNTYCLRVGIGVLRNWSRIPKQGAESFAAAALGAIRCGER
jgi:hypothetical protein